MKRTSLALVLLAAAAFAEPRVARAQATLDRAMAESLFQAARSLALQEKFAEACPKFAESQRLDPKLGTLMNLALCHEKEGKAASAWLEYMQASQQAGRAGQSERAAIAKAGASRMEPMLAHLVLQAAPTDGLVLTVDGVAVSAAALSTPIPIDPGPHDVAASAPGRQRFTAKVVVPAGPGDSTVSVPALEPDVVAAPLPPAPAPAPESHGHVLAYSLITGGGVGIVVGAVFGGLAFAEKSAAEGQCTPAGVCSSRGSSDISMKSTSEVISTIGIGVGVAAVGVGVVLLVKDPHGAPPAAVTIGVRPGGALLTGTF